jgi:hypothetical protein
MDARIIFEAGLVPAHLDEPGAGSRVSLSEFVPARMSREQRINRALLMQDLRAEYVVCSAALAHGGVSPSRP